MGNEKGNALRNNKDESNGRVKYRNVDFVPTHLDVNARRSFINKPPLTREIKLRAVKIRHRVSLFQGVFR